MGSRHLIMKASALILVCVVGTTTACSSSFFQALFQILGGGGGSGPTTSRPPPTTRPTMPTKPTEPTKPTKPTKPPGPSPNGTITGQCECGIANKFTKIVNGKPTEQHEYPWQVGLMPFKMAKYPFCGGSIISNKEIMTAAHCTAGKRPSDVWVMVGGHKLGSLMTKEQRVEVCGIKNHPGYNPRTTNNDFAILVLCSELEFGREVAPVCLPTEKGLGQGYEGKLSIVSGWGTTESGGRQPDILQDVMVDTMSNEKCTNSQTVYQDGQITSAMICAAAPDKDSCQGDSGGPLITNMGPTSFLYPKSYFLIGVVSWGYGCAQANAPGVYARVTWELDWINSNIAGEKCSPMSTMTG